MRFIVFLALVALIWSACTPCDRYECASSDYELRLRLLRQSDRADLLFGSSRRYVSRNLYAYHRQDTGWAYVPIQLWGSGGDSVLHMLLGKVSDTVYLQLSPTDRDTILVDNRKSNSRCCGTLDRYSNFRYNGTLIPDFRPTATVLKP